MNLPFITRRCIVVAVLTLAATFGLNHSSAVQRGPPDVDEGMEVLTRGPVHEAFAETVTFDPQPGFVAPQPAPEAIEELPPEHKPEGANVDWIPGYWAWDDERDDFLWVSGLWRALPPGRQWVPGYWGRSAEGVQWTSGYWADALSSEVEYLPEPPATVEEGPSYAAPSANHIWTPGCWVWSQTRYAWQPGSWLIAQPNWTWVPSHYVWAPRGYVFVNGYYDHSVARRGVLFAPVYFTSSVYARRGFSYSPVTVINPRVFTSHLFLRPSYGHYYFGDYYGANYSSRGFSPWFSFYSSRSGYDPFYAHQRWHHRNDRQWQQRVEADFAHRRDHEDTRPPRTWAAQRARMTRGGSPNQESFVVAAPLEQLARSKDSPVRFQTVEQNERQRLAKHSQEIQRFRQERQRVETRAVTPTADVATQAARTRVKLSRSPILAKSAGELGKGHAPPQSHVAPQPDPKVQPRQRVSRPPHRPVVTLPTTQRVEQPVGERTTETRVEKPASKRQSALKARAEQPRPKTQTAPNRQPQPRVEQATPQPQTAPHLRPRPQSQVDQAGGKRDARLEQPRPQPQAQSRPAPRPSAQAQPRVEQPKAQPQPQAKARQPAPRPQPQPRVEQPKAPPQRQAKVQPSTPQPQPKAAQPAGPPAGPKQDKPKGKN